MLAKNIVHTLIVDHHGIPWENPLEVWYIMVTTTAKLRTSLKWSWLALYFSMEILSLCLFYVCLGHGNTTWCQHNSYRQKQTLRWDFHWEILSHPSPFWWDSFAVQLHCIWQSVRTIMIYNSTMLSHSW